MPTRGHSFDNRSVLRNDLVMPAEGRWWTNHGWAKYGSKLQTQLYVNHHPKQLTAAVLDGLPDLAAKRPTAIQWVVPLAEQRFAEPKDRTMLAALGLDTPKMRNALREFWPSGGPNWDALATVTFQREPTGVLLVEGKSHVGELYSDGTQAGEQGTADSLKNLERIKRSVAWVQQEIGAPLDVDRWLYPIPGARGALYQTANRIAYAVWFRKLETPAWACHVLFINDPSSPKPTSRETFERGLARAERELGIAELKLPFLGHAYLDGLDHQAELAALRQPPS